MWSRNNRRFRTADYRRAAAAIIDSLGLLRGFVGSYAWGEGVVEPEGDGAYQHRPDTVLYPVLVKMNGHGAKIVFDGPPWTSTQVERVYKALVSLLPPVYHGLRLSHDRMWIRVAVKSGTHAVERLNTDSTTR